MSTRVLLLVALGALATTFTIVAPSLVSWLAMPPTIALAVICVAAIRDRNRWETQARRDSTIIESAQSAIITTTDGDIISTWIPAAKTIFDWSAAEAIGNPLISLIRDPDGRHTRKIKNVAALARGERVLAEGVETAAQMDQVRAVNSDYAQGYFISRSLAASALADLLARAAHRAALPLMPRPRPTRYS